MSKTISMGLNQCLTKYPCSGHGNNNRFVDGSESVFLCHLLMR